MESRRGVSPRAIRHLEDTRHAARRRVYLRAVFSEQLFTRLGALMAHEKTIAQSRDRQGADPLADARGSVPNIYFRNRKPNVLSF
jgi:hypothetical protein